EQAQSRELHADAVPIVAGWPRPNRSGLVPMGWAEVVCRIESENESVRVIPQQKEDVVPGGIGPAGGGAAPEAAAVAVQKWKKPLSALEIGRELLVELLGRQHAAEKVAVDEEGRRRLHPVANRARPRLLDRPQHLLIVEAILEALPAE